MKPHPRKARRTGWGIWSFNHNRSIPRSAGPRSAVRSEPLERLGCERRRPQLIRRDFNPRPSNVMTGLRTTDRGPRTSGLIQLTGAYGSHPALSADDQHSAIFRTRSAQEATLAAAAAAGAAHAPAALGDRLRRGGDVAHRPGSTAGHPGGEHAGDRAAAVSVRADRRAARGRCGPVRLGDAGRESRRSGLGAVPARQRERASLRR